MIQFTTRFLFSSFSLKLSGLPHKTHTSNPSFFFSIPTKYKIKKTSKAFFIYLQFIKNKKNSRAIYDYRNNIKSTWIDTYKYIYSHTLLYSNCLEHSYKKKKRTASNKLVILREKVSTTEWKEKKKQKYI